MSEKNYTFQSGEAGQGTQGEGEIKTRRSSAHKPCFIALVIVNAVFLIAVFVFNGLSTTGSGLFTSTQKNQSDKYNLEITPAGWTFSIWGFIYTWQALWVLYSVVNLFRSTQHGPLYLNPPLLPPSLFVLYIVASATNIAWLFLFDRDEIQASLAVLLLSTISLIAGLAVSYRALDKACPDLVAQGRCVDVSLVRGFVHNGLAIYGTWASIASLLNLAMVIAYSDGSQVSVRTASTVALGILTAEIVVFVFTDLVLLDRFSRYTFTPYIVFVVALSGSISKNWQSGATNSIFTAVLLALGGLALVAKVVVSIYRHITRPPFCGGNVKPTL